MANHNHYSDIDDVRLVLMDAVSDGATGISDAVMVRGALNAYTLINAKLGKLYTVPFPLSTTDNTPDIIREISDTLTACWSNRHTVGLGVKGRGPTADECKRAREQLDELASGDMVIAGYSSSALPSSNTEGEHPIFFKGDTMDMGQDADQSARLSDERD